MKHWFQQLVIALDQLLNVLSTPGSEEAWADESLSSRCGRLGHRSPYKYWKVLIDAIFYLFQGPNHCVNAYNKEMTMYQFPPIMRNNTSLKEANRES
jgi:hypothetical protein